MSEAMDVDTGIELRRENAGDYASIKNVNDLAFGQPNEGLLVERIRRNPQFIPELSLVALSDGSVVGHILFFPVRIVADDYFFTSLSLAPMAVRPGFQGRGIGGRLVRTGTAVAREMGFESVLVVGHPGYYPRFGFQPAGRWGVRAPFEVPDEAFMALELVADCLAGRAGVVEFPPEYDEAM